MEYETKQEAAAAIAAMNNSKFMGQPIAVDWAFHTGASRYVRVLTNH